MVSSFPVRHFHDLHTFVKHMIDSGIDLDGIGKIFGHTDPPLKSVRFAVML
jgi:site-specific recombinase XerD